MTYPGGASRIAGRPFCRRALTSRMRGGAIATPTSRHPWTRVMLSDWSVFTTPMRLSASRIAFLGHTFAHPPQPWHISAKTSGFVPNETMAWYSQNRPHSPQPSHSNSSTCGTEMLTISSLRGDAFFKNRCAFGSSTSQSRSWTGVPKTRARFTETVVLPVPPLPEAIAIIMIQLRLYNLSRPRRRAVSSASSFAFKTFPLFEPNGP